MSVIHNLALHFVGYKQADEGIHCSPTLLSADDSMRNLLHECFLPLFLNEEQYRFRHETDLKYNEVYGIVSDIFDDPDSLLIHSVKLAKQLYDKSDHPKIKAGEFCVVLFTDCSLAGQHCDAVGLFGKAIKTGSTGFPAFAEKIQIAFCCKHGFTIEVMYRAYRKISLVGKLKANGIYRQQSISTIGNTLHRESIDF